MVGKVPADTHKNIVYPCSICTDSTNAEAAAEFIEWATTDPEALKTWQEWGFELATDWNEAEFAVRQVKPSGRGAPRQARFRAGCRLTSATHTVS